MSTLDNSRRLWRPISTESLDSKYEKCRNITEEIYKRINITFQIKNLEVGSQSELSCQSDQIDSNDLSNETDLFAYEHDSISSTVSEREARNRAEKYINVNNNEETRIKKSLVPIYKRPKKRFRKRVKKRQSKAKSDSEGSSDEAVPLSRIIDLEPGGRGQDAALDDSKSESPDNVMGVPKLTILGILGADIKDKNKDPKPHPKSTFQAPTLTPAALAQKSRADEKTREERRQCGLCSLTFRAERGLRRHVAISHSLDPAVILPAPPPRPA